MKIRFSALLILLFSVSLYAEAPSAPPLEAIQGIDPAAVIRISETLAFVVTKDSQPSKTLNKQTREREIIHNPTANAPVRGYFIVARNGTWLRLDPESKGTMFPVLNN